MNSLVSQSQFETATFQHAATFAAAAPRAAGLRRGDVAEIVRSHASFRPDAPVFLHKRHGRWQLFNWAFVAREVERLGAVLRARSLSGETRLAVSGAYEPDLVILSLAALANGGEVSAVAPSLRGEALSEALGAIVPTHAFVQGRRTISHWYAAAPGDAARIPLFAAQGFIGGSAAWDIVPLRDPALTLDVRGGLRRRLSDVVWVDEGTEWSDGLARIIERALSGGGIVAFPETSGSALRDRREVQPGALLVSPARRHRLEDEERARRAPEGSLARALSDRADAAPHGFVSRLVNRRRRAVLGLGRTVADAVAPADLADAAPTPASA